METDLQIIIRGMTYSVCIWYTHRNPWDSSHILLCNGNSQRSEGEHQTSKENHAECSPSQHCAWVRCFSRGSGGSTCMTLVTGRGDGCVPPSWSHQLSPAGGWMCSLVRHREQEAQATAAKCTQVMPVALLSLQCYTEQKVFCPRRHLPETRTWRWRCLPGHSTDQPVQQEVLCISKGRLHAAQQRLLPAVEVIHIPHLARSKVLQKVNPYFQEKAKRCAQRD